VDVGLLSGVWQETYITNLRIKLWGVDVGFLSGVWRGAYKTNLRIKLCCGYRISLWSVAGNLYNIELEDRAVMWMLDYSLECGRRPI
jgi:hypothetical protein